MIKRFERKINVYVKVDTVPIGTGRRLRVLDIRDIKVFVIK